MVDDLSFFFPATNTSVFVANLLIYENNWSNICEDFRRYDYSKFSQKPDNGLNKYKAVINGYTVIFTVKCIGETSEYNLEISSPDEPNIIHEIPYVSDAANLANLKTLEKHILENENRKLRELSKMLSDCTNPRRN